MRICFFQARTGLVEPAMRFELMTSSLPRRRSTPELRGLKSPTNPEKLERATRFELATLSLEG